ncbi:phosphate ABC transporter substrate-binding protein, PhoT family [Methylomagnum ishizawai]|uniref:Phosphate ABC transporter substrate-binding protein, PhoT family n=1 Tax=Methylomagnum ishizawai TaxID=1760988 RepID=A0A1Y6CTH1_9GAMM|nr:PstS family phosphate ABC transporter substrate-binding protein [Methylomagnum ishizawai]SMF93500.1 phosphate ABC transporter substrate-binding protein, PhoT family [Methylomagnum ishizawai]
MNNKLLIASALAAGLALTQGADAAEAGRDYISIVGSSTVYPFATVVAEQFGKGGKFKTPKVEATGTGGGIKLFCGGVGVQYPDIANASRAMKKTEFETCQKAGVKDIVEVKIGFDGIVAAQSKKSKDKLELTRKELYLALAKRVPDPAKPDGDALVENPYKTWNEINPKLPNVKIEVLGPPPTSGTRDAFAELALEGGCAQIPWIKAKKETDDAWFKNVCMTVREDGAYIEAGENDNLIVQKLEANPTAVGIFGYSFLDQNSDKLLAAPVDGVAPSYEHIASGKYAISRPLFFYVKKAHVGVIPGIEAYVTEFTSEKAFGEEGYLADKGLIPLPEAERKHIATAAKKMTPMTMK